MRPLNSAILVLLGTFFAGSARECEAQQNQWFESREEKAWFIGHLEGNEFPVVHPDDDTDDPARREAIGLMIHIEKRGLGLYIATVHAYFEHGPDENNVDRYRERRLLHKLRLVQQNNKPGRGELLFTPHALGNDPEIISEMTLHGIPNRLTGTNTILCGFRFRSDAPAPPVYDCDEPPMEDILEEEDFDEEIPEDEEPLYIEEDPEYPEETPANGE